MFLSGCSRRVGRAASASSRWAARPRQPMPLKARISAPGWASSSQMSTSSSAPWGSSTSDDPDDVLFGSLFGLRVIELNRPKKLNSLNASMIRKIGPRLLEWEKSDMANVVVIKGAGEKAFCAGGDVAAIAKLNEQGEEGIQQSISYFNLEYKLDHLIATYGKPYVAFMDGITMGGGVGLSIHAPLRIATERTVFAMPETNIGFFPDVGASFFLPRMDGALGTYLAMTSDRLKGVQAYYSGVATHYIHSTSLPSLESRLAELHFRDSSSLPERLRLIADTIDEFATGVPHDEPLHLGRGLRKAVDRIFSKTTYAEILQALEAEAKSDAANKQTREWAAATLQTIHERSPTAALVACRQMRIGREWSIDEAFSRELQMAAKFMRQPDFNEGVSSLLIRKPPTKPQWNPPLETITSGLQDGKDYAKPFFEVDQSGPHLDLLPGRPSYSEYPHANLRLGLPSEADVMAVVNEWKTQGKSVRPEAVMKHFLAEWRNKQGVREVVEDITSRRL